MLEQSAILKILVISLFLIFLTHFSYHRYLKLRDKMSKSMIKPYLQETFFVAISIIVGFWYLNPNLEVWMKYLASLILLLFPLMPVVSFILWGKFTGKKTSLNYSD